MTRDNVWTTDQGEIPITVSAPHIEVANDGGVDREWVAEPETYHSGEETPRPQEVTNVMNSIGEMASLIDSRLASKNIRQSVKNIIDEKMLTDLKTKINNVLIDETKRSKTTGTCSFFKDGKLYQANLTEYVDVEGAVASWTKQLSENMAYVMMEQVQEYYRKCVKVLNEVNAKISVFVSPPDLALTMKYDIKVGSYYSERNKKLYITYTLPFVYHPKYVNGAPIVRPKIEPRHVYIIFPYISFLDAGVQKMALQTGNICLITSDMKTFPHYHYNNPLPISDFTQANSCWGSVKFNSFYEVNQLPALRDHLQLTLENINKGSPYTHDPEGLPRLGSIVCDTDPDKKIEWIG